MSLSVFHGCLLSLTVSPVPWSCYMSLIFAGCLSLSYPVPLYCCMSLTLFSCSMELLHVYHCHLWFLAVSQYFYQYHGGAASLSLSPIVAD